MKIEQLSYFLELAEQLNYTAVASSFYISQPTLSRQIANLELELKTKLFFRDHNTVQLTEEGEQFYRRLKPIFSDLTALIEETQSQDPSKNELNIGVQEDQRISETLSSAISRLREVNPVLKVNIQRSSPDKLLEGLENGDFDLVNMLYFGDVHLSPSIDFLETEQESMYMAVSQNLEPEMPKQITLSDFRAYLDKYPLLLPSLFEHDAAKISSDHLLQNLGILVEDVHVNAPGSSMTLELQVSQKLGISISNRTSMFSIDPDVQIIEIMDSPNFIKGVFYTKPITEQLIQTLIQWLKSELKGSTSVK